MARTWPLVTRCALIIVGLCAAALVAASDDFDVRKANQLALQQALQQGLEHLNNKNYREAVAILEKKMALIDGNRRYLMALRDAYRGYVQQLQQAGKHAEAKTYQRLLAILEPSTQRPTSIPPAQLVIKEPEQPEPREKIETAPAPEKPPPAPLASKPTGIIGRGKAEDPFDESGSGGKRGRSLLAQAESEFNAAHYEKACQLFDRAERAEPGVTAGCQGQWDYCQKFLVMQSVKVRHTPRQGNGWAMTETTNFRIFHAQAEEAADKIAVLVEATRAMMMRKWFGEDFGPWSPRCDVYLHPTVKGYMQCEGHPPAVSPGHSTIKLDSGRVVLRRIDVRCDEPNMMSAVLPHETTHVVLAGNFGGHHVPRWADEGMAVLSEPARINLHLRNLPKHKHDGTLFSLGKLMQMQDYPEARLIGPFYAQGVSLEFLTKKKGASTFTRFVREGLERGYEVALKNHYGYRDFAELERDWQQYAFGEAAIATAEKRK